MLLCKIHRNLAHLHVITLTALAECALLTDTIMVAYLLENIVDSQWTVVDLHRTHDDTLSQMHINIRVIDN